ncbi:MAG: adenosylcobinamide-GDP ribazoletransferase [Bacillota bacterium]
MRSFLLALQLLTRIPVRIKGEIYPGEMTLAATMFPVVALLIGGLMAITYYLALLVLPGPLPAWVVVAIVLFLTGGLHLDGLMDTADGVFSGRTRETALVIMKDSRAGAMGVIACVLDLGIKTAAINSLVTAYLYPVLLLTPVIARAAMVLSMRYPYARRGEGTGSPFAGRVGVTRIMFASILALVIAVLVLGLKGAFLAVATWLISMGVAWWLAKRLGGMTGDTYGFINEITEISFLLLALIIQYY